MANISYLRATALGIDVEQQRAIISGQSIQIDQEYIDYAGVKTYRKVLDRMLQELQTDDVLYVASIAGCARSSYDFVKLSDIVRQKGVSLVVIAESIDTRTEEGQRMMSIFDSFLSLDKEYHKQLRLSGMEAALETHKQGRPRLVLSPTFKRRYKQWQDGLISASDCYKAEGIKRSSFYKIVKDIKEGKIEI